MKKLIYIICACALFVSLNSKTKAQILSYPDSNTLIRKLNNQPRIFSGTFTCGMTSILRVRETEGLYIKKNIFENKNDTINLSPTKKQIIMYRDSLILTVFYYTKNKESQIESGTLFIGNVTTNNFSKAILKSGYIEEVDAGNCSAAHIIKFSDLKLEWLN